MNRRAVVIDGAMRQFIAPSPEDIQEPEQTMDLWRGVIVSRFKLAGTAVTVMTVCAPDSDTIGLWVRSPLVKAGKLRVTVAFPHGYDMSVKNTPALDWSHPASHESELFDRGPLNALIRRTIDGTRYLVFINTAVTRTDSHDFRITGDGSGKLPGIPRDGTWKVRAEGLRPLP
jgi:hypothetical protein